MTLILFIAAILVLTVEGLVICFVPGMQRISIGGRLAVAFATGLTINAILLTAESVLGIPWLRAALLVPSFFFAAIGILAARKTTWRIEKPSADWIPVLVIMLIMFYGAATARLTCGDLILFWGPKATHFATAAKIDLAYLGNGDYYLAHPDYPPLLPLTYAWGINAARAMSWFGAVIITQFFLLAAALVVGAYSRRPLHAALFAAVLALGAAVGMIAGAADMLLVFYEVVAVCALTFEGDDRSSFVIASIALLGGAMTKVEGASLAAIIVFAFAITRRRLIAATVMALPAGAFLVAWIASMRHFHLLDSYDASKSSMHLEYTARIVQEMAREMSYRTYYLPWIAAISPLFFGRNMRRAAFPLLVGILTIGCTAWFYYHCPVDPWFWVRSSANRVLLTSLAPFVVATAAAPA